MHSYVKNGIKNASLVTSKITFYLNTPVSYRVKGKGKGKGKGHPRTGHEDPEGE